MNTRRFSIRTLLLGNTTVILVISGILFLFSDFLGVFELKTVDGRFHFRNILNKNPVFSSEIIHINIDNLVIPKNNEFKCKGYAFADFKTEEERDEFIEKHQLPFHPLVAKGYNSIGCTHCTVPGEDRSGRWNNNPKTECGLHL